MRSPRPQFGKGAEEIKGLDAPEFLIGQAKVAMESEKILLCGLEVLLSPRLQLLFVELGRNSVLVGHNLTLDSPATWRALQQGLDVDILGRLGEFSLESRERLGANLASVAGVVFGPQTWGGRGCGLRGRRPANGGAGEEAGGAGDWRLGGRVDLVGDGGVHVEFGRRRIRRLDGGDGLCQVFSLQTLLGRSGSLD